MSVEQTQPVRVYETKICRQLASGEIKEYTIKSRYVPKKKAGPGKTEINKQRSKCQSMIRAYFHNLSLAQLQMVEDLCERLNSGELRITNDSEVPF